VVRPLITADGLGAERTTIGLHTYDPGGSSPHQPGGEREIALYVLDGIMTARVADTEFSAREGDLVFVPRGIPCSFENGGQRTLSFLHIAIALDKGAARQAQGRGVYHLRTSEIEPVEVGGGHKDMISRQCIRPERVDTERLALDISTYSSGGGNRPLAHADAEQVYYVMAGKMQAFVADREYDAQPGEIVFIPRNTIHWHENPSADEMTYMLIGTKLD
jgi:quercetin dioxygenase-like cupin family protein